MSSTDRTFPPDYAKLPVPATGEDLQAYLVRLVSTLNDYEDHDVNFEAPGVSYAVVHGLRRVPSFYDVMWADSEATIFADTAKGWGYNVVYFQSNAAARVRIRLR